MLHGAGEFSVHRVILQHIGHILRIHERIVDGCNLHTLVSQCGAEHQAADAAETIDTDFCNHKQNPFPTYKQV